MPESALRLVDTDTGEIEEYVPSFGDFWLFYPRREARKDALRAWEHLTEGERVRAIVGAAIWAKIWAKEGRERRYTPLPASWVRGERFDDEVPAEYGSLLQTGESTPQAMVPDEIVARQKMPEHVVKALAEFKLRQAVKP